MIKTLRFALLAALMLVCGHIAAQQVTLDFSTNGWNLPTDLHVDKGSFTYKGYTITLQSGVEDETDGYYRYNTKQQCLVLGSKGATLTLPTFDFPVSKIEIVGGYNNGNSLVQNIFVGSVPVSQQTTGYGANLINTYDIDENYQVAGTTFTLKVLNARHTTINKINIYKADGTKKSPALQFSAKTVDYTLGDVFNAPTFTKQTTAKVTFSSDNEEVATVDANGTISVTGKATGTAIITAKAEANAEYKAGTATCTINVAAKPETATYKKVTTVVPGKKYLIVAQTDNKTYYAKYMEKTHDAGNGVIPTEYVDGYVDELKVDPAYTGTYTIETTAKGYSIKDTQNRYLSLEGNSTQITALPDVKYSFTIEPQADGTFKIAMYGQFIILGPSARNPEVFGATSNLKDYNTMPMLYMLSEQTAGVDNVSVSKKAANNAIYNLAGQRVGKDYKGIVIINGKKMLQK